MSNKLTKVWRHEPVRIVTAIQAGIALAIGMGWVHLTVEQVGFLMAFIVAVFGVILRRTVYAPANVSDDSLE